MIRCKLIELAGADSAVAGARTGRSVTAEALSIGRATSCKIYIPDPTIRLDHAGIYRAEDGHLYLQASGPVFIEQKLQSKVRMQAGQLIVIGPYEFHVDALSDGADLATAVLTLSYGQPDNKAVAPAVSPQDLIAGGWTRFFSRRLLAWALSLLVIIFCGVLPLQTAQTPLDATVPASQSPMAMMEHALQSAGVSQLDAFWNPGQISSAHQNFGSQCRLCHDRPFERVRDVSCLACHTTVGDHIADKGLQHDAFNGQRCATCHKDHQGPSGMKKVDAIGCVECHDNIKAYAAKSKLDDIGDFADKHPPFKLSMVQADGAPGSLPTVKRVAQTPALKNPNGLKFPHDVHLAKAGIKSPTGDPAKQGRVVLECASCHVPNAAGYAFETVRMEKNCQGCHRLAVSPQAPERQLTHGKPADVAVAVREMYASLALDRYPVQLTTVNSLLQRPADKPIPAQLLPASRWIQAQTQASLLQMFESPKGVCLTCHQITPKPDVGDWLVAPVVYTHQWLPKSRFSHLQHKNTACDSCHAAAQSKDASDLLIPDIDSCRTCHAGSKPSGNKVVSSCDNCHGFHAPVLHAVFKEAGAGKISP
jgi:hypothetical protein